MASAWPGFSEMVLTVPDALTRVDADIPLDIAAVLGCAVRTGVGAVLNTAQVQEGESVLVLGLGGVGQSIVMGAKLASAGVVVVSDPVAARREAALELGADVAIDPNAEDVVERTREVTSGRGADYAFDAVGSGALVQTGFDATTPGGATVIVGVGADSTFSVPLGQMVVQEKRILGSLIGSSLVHRDVPRFLELWRAGRLDLDRLITGRRPIEEINDGLRRHGCRSRAANRGLVRVTATDATTGRLDMTETMSYEQARRDVELAVPLHFNFTTDVIDSWAARSPDDLALVAVAADESVRHHTIADISREAARAASLLHQQGVRQGDRVFVLLPRVADWYAAMLGCFKIGAVPIPGTTQLTSHDIEYRLQTAAATAAIVHVDSADRVDAIADNCPDLTVKLAVGGSRSGWTPFATEVEPMTSSVKTRSDDPLLIYFTSGTTALPKMVLHTQASLGIGHELTARYWHDLRPGDLHWTVSDFGWAKAAWGKLFGAWRLGAAMFLWDIVGKPDYDLMMRMIGTHRITSFCAPPTIYRSLVQMDLGAYDWSSLRHCTAAGEPLNPEVISVWKGATARTIYDGYGQTETVCLVANYPWMEVRPGSMGRPMPGFDVDVVDDDGNRLGPDEEGHIAVRTDPRPVGLFREYWLDEERTASVFQNGWYYTGDKATRDPDGYFWFVGRSDDVILSAGYRIGPFEVESALLEHVACMETAVIGKPDVQRGEVVKAFVVLADGFTPSQALATELQDHVKSVTAPYKYPREIEFVIDLPKTISGKIRRVELREREAAASLEKE